MARKKFFIAGTDTDVGKTLIACGLLEAANNAGLRTLAIKPVAAGCEQTPDGLRNSDALALMAAMSLDLDYAEVNPVAFADPIAPHIAAQRATRSLSVARLAGFCNGVMMLPADFMLVEGAGGWRVPLNLRETMADLPRTLNLPVILVVGMRLGCINHALLTAEAIKRDGLTLAGWVANRLDPDMSCYADNIETLQALIRAPLLGQVPYLAAPDRAAVAAHLDIAPLLA
jgi:dethiobiotin synthetase